MKVLVYGAGGHGKVVADALEREARCEIGGFLDDNPKLRGTEVYGYRVLGGFDGLARNIENPMVIVAVGDNGARRRLAERLVAHGVRFAQAIHPSAQIARDVRFGPGVMIMANAAVNPGCRVGAHVILNTTASVDHDCVIGDFVHISPAAVLAGNVWIGEGTHVGMACAILPGVKIGANCVIGAGSVVNRDVPDGVTVVGVPARRVSMKELDITRV